MGHSVGIAISMAMKVANKRIATIKNIRSTLNILTILCIIQAADELAVGNDLCTEQPVGQQSDQN
jgi:hypothetical protein